MPLFGALELDLAAPRLPLLRDLDAETWTLPQAEILQLAFEVPRATHALLPRACSPPRRGKTRADARPPAP